MNCFILLRFLQCNNRSQTKSSCQVMIKYNHLHYSMNNLYFFFNNNYYYKFLLLGILFAFFLLSLSTCFCPEHSFFPL